MTHVEALQGRFASSGYRATRPHLTRRRCSVVGSRWHAAEQREAAGVVAPFLVADQQQRQQVCSTSASASASSSGSTNGSSSTISAQQLPALTVRQAQDSGELRAAACLRAASFYTYPADRSKFAQQSHRRLKADHEWHTLEDKVAGQDEHYKHLAVTCLIATVDDDSDADPGSVAAAVFAEEGLDRSGKLPQEGPGRPPQVVVGTLDINQGISLPSEELIGLLPPGADDTKARRAYLSNVCVAGPARRLGVGAALIAAALERGRSDGVTHMYVHVAADNAPALRLYRERCGFAVEAEESEARGRALGRPRRLLLVKETA